MTVDLKRVQVKSQYELRNWLRKNHKQAESIWLVTFKKSVPEFYLEYSKIVDEALCFGWIDSLPRALDSERTMIRLSPRKPKSVWSKINRDKAKRLTNSGDMTTAGLAAIESAKRNGSWDALKSTDGNKIPKDLKFEFKKYPTALKNFEKFPQSTRRAILEWIAIAKTTETRRRRIETTAAMAEKNVRANQKPKY